MLNQPVPTTAFGADVKVGANNVTIVPVGVYVGRSATCVPVKEGEMVAGGNVWSDAWAGNTVPAPNF